MHDNKEETKYQCKFCESKFVFKSGLQKHLTSIHGEKSFNCMRCPFKANQKVNLDTHVKAVHI